MERARALCGYYILQTSEIAMQDERVEGYYKQLREVEDVFRDLKDLIDIRPVYHWIDRRVKTHIFLCLLSLGSLRRGTKKAQGRRLAGEEKRAHSGKVHHPSGRLKPPLHKNGSTSK